MAKKFAFCESVHATSSSSWHLRILHPGDHLKLGGGIQTGSLCGLVGSGKGWDLPMADIDAHADRTCKKCRELYLEALRLANVVVTRRADDYHVCFEAEPGKWSCDKTVEAAIGNLVRSWPEAFGVKIIEKETPCASQPTKS